MKEVPISKIKSQCLSLIDEVERTGEPVMITKDGQPYAMIRPVRGWTLGKSVGKVQIVGDIMAPLDETWTCDEDNFG